MEQAIAVVNGSAPESADIVVGLPTFNNAETAGRIVAAALESLRRDFNGHCGVIVQADGGSTDGTQERVTAAAPDADNVLRIDYARHPAQKLALPYHGIPGKAVAYRTIFEIAGKMDAKACVVADADLCVVNREWITALVQPVLEQQYDFVAPNYARHKFDGAINSGIVYPLTRALYGKKVRQPLGGDFGFSAALASDLISEDSWGIDDAQAGADVAVVTRALTGGYRVCQAYLGPKVPHTREQSMDVSSMLVQVVGAVFHEMDRNAAIWQRIRGIEIAPALGIPRSPGSEVAAVDVQKMIDQFRFGTQNLFEVWSLILPPATLVELKRVARCAPEQFLFPDETWVRAVYDFALGYRLRVINRDHLLRAMTPLYLGWVASLVSQMKDASLEQVEGRIEQLCQVYETMKPYLISRWRWPDRFNP